MPKILVVDDQRNMRTTLAMLLRSAGTTWRRPPTATRAPTWPPAAPTTSSSRTSGWGQFDGLRVLRAVKESNAATEVIVMTAYGTIESAVEAMRLGAFDYIQKPSNEQELLLKVERANHNRSLARENVFLKSEFKEKYRFDNIVGRSQSVTEVLSRIAKVAPPTRPC